VAIELPDDLIALQQAADDEGRKIEHLDDDERDKQRRVWFEAAAKAQAAVTAFAQLRQDTRHPQGDA